MLSSLHLLRLELLNKLSIEPTRVHKKESCCETSLDETQLDCLDNCFEMSSKLTESEKSTLYYNCGYINQKKGLVTPEKVTLGNIKESDFTKLVSTGHLSHLSKDLYWLSQNLFAYYKSVSVKSWANRLVETFQEICDVAYTEFDKSIFNRLCCSIIGQFNGTEKGSEKDRYTC